MMHKKALRTILILFLFGAILGNAFNSMHAFSGAIPVTTVHSKPLVDWSSYLLFGFAGVSIGFLTLLFDRIFRKESQHTGPSNAISAMIMLGFFYFISACIFLSDTLIFFILTAGLILAMLLYDRHGLAFLAALIVAVIGTTAEIVQVNFHSYYYARPQIWGVTWWLPLLYGIASVTTGQLARAVHYNDSHLKNKSIQ